METILTQSPAKVGQLRNFSRAFLIFLLCLGGSTAFAQTILVEGFESATFPPTGTPAGNNWTSTASSSSYPWTRVGSYTGSPSIAVHGGSAMARYNSFSASGGYTAELITPKMNFTSSNQVVVSFWMYRDAGYSGYTNEKVDVYVNTSATSTGGTLIGSVIRWSGGVTSTAGAVATDGWYLYSFNVPTSFNSASNYVTFKATSQFGNDMFIDDVNIYNLAPCTSTPTAGTLSPSCGTTNNVCPGSTFTLTSTGYTVAANISFQWMYSTNGGTTWLPAPGVNNTSTYITPSLTQNMRFHLVVTCANTGTSDSTCNIIYNVTTGFPTYASLPFNESFESWTNGCNTSDLPSTNWTNIPATGNSAFRREDQGSTASWATPTGGAYTPVSAVGSHSARFHAYNAPLYSARGTLSAYVDCSATGNKDLQFYLLTDPNSYTLDSVYVDYSTNGGATFTNLAKYGMGTGKWDFKTLTLPSNSATTVVRWTAWQAYQYTGYGDIGIDGIKILPPCGAKPTAGTIDSVTACAGKNFTLSLSNTSASAGLVYQWQYMAAGSTAGWSNLPGGFIARPTANITVPTYFRAIVSCGNLTPSPADTSAQYLVKISPFYYCYCDVPTAVSPYPQYAYAGIGNASIATRPAGVVIMSNGNPIPATSNPGVTRGYRSFAGIVPAPTLIRDSTYRFSIQAATWYAGTSTGSYTWALYFLDVNRNGIWDLPQERIMTKNISSFSTPVVQDYQIPTNAQVGLTGLRAICGYYLNTTNIPDPCGGTWYYNGSAEDYLVYLEYQPCTGPVTAGTAYISDTSVCPGYTVDMWDTGYQKTRTGIGRIWQTSTNGGASFNNIPGSAGKDTLFNVVIPPSSFGVKFRLAVWCGNTGDTTYSNWLSVVNPPASACYPFASAIPPGTKDSSDIGSFVIGPLNNPYVNPAPMAVSGPHLLNPAANRRRTDYTYVGPWVLAADSTYRISVFHTMRSATHADAIVSVFIDFNRDGLYTVSSPGYPFPPELVFRGRTTATNFYLDTTFKMPSTLIGGVPTGLRVVLNNDLDVNTPGNGNDGRGGFVSGEVEDYTVILSRSNLGVGGVPGLIRNMGLYPNPTASKATLSFETSGATGVKHLEVTVSTITGQRVMSSAYDNVGAHFSAELNLAGKAKGVYFVEVNADGEKTTQKLVLQ